MYKPEQYDPSVVKINYEYNNPALCKINGVLTGYCVLCGQYLGNEHDTNWFSLIKREYCPTCRVKVRTEQNTLRQKKHRRSKKQLKKDYEQQTNLLKQENSLLREAVMALRDDVEQLKAGVQ